MNTLEKLYNITYNENIMVESFNWSNTKAKILNYDNAYYIVMDYSKINNSKEEKEILAEELGHYYCNALYPITADNTLIRKCELRALKWAYSVLIPYERLKKKIKDGLNIYELSEYFEVDPQYMLNCVNFYIEKYGIIN